MRDLISRATVVLIILAFGGLGAPPAGAQVRLAQFDYFNEAGNSSSDDLLDSQEYIAQTLVCARDGELASVDLVSRSYPDSNPSHVSLTVQLRSVYDAAYNGYLPTNTVLATGSIAYDDPEFADGLSDWVTVPMSAYDLVAGERYAVAILTTPTTDEAYSWHGRWTPGSDPYPDGRTCIYYSGSGGYFNFTVNSDLGFRVNGVPEPATVALLGLGSAALAVRRRRRR